MFVIYAIPLGILVGLARGGRLGNLAGLRFEWGRLAIAGPVVAIAAGMAPRPPAGIGAPATPKGPTPVPSGTSPE